MTIIPDDTANTGDRPDVADRVERAGERAEDSTRRIAAAIHGAIEGFVEAMDRYDVATEGKRAIHDAGEIARAAASEGSTQAQTPEMQQLREQAANMGHRMSAAGHSAAGTVSDKAHHATDVARQTATDVRETVTESIESAKYAAHRVKEEVKVRAEAVGETGRRARVAPGHIRHEIGQAVSSWKRALVTSIAMMALIALFGITAFIVLTIALVAGFALLIGYVGALFLVTLLYVAAAGIAYAVARGAKTKAASEREERMQNVREEMRHVVRPVKDAFRGRAY